MPFGGSLWLNYFRTALFVIFFYVLIELNVFKVFFVLKDFKVFKVLFGFLNPLLILAPYSAKQ
jgi:hypothetical protein